MLAQIKKLSAVSLCNLFGVNEVRYTRDKKKKARFFGLAAVWLILLACLMLYVTVVSEGLVMMDMAELIPVSLAVVCSMMILVFTFFKAGSVLFQMHTYELLVSLPVSHAAIVVSRFFTMYVTNLLFCIPVIVPGMAVYALSVRPGITFYLFGVVGILFLPLLPITVATAAGAAITAVSARMKHKSMAASFLTLFVAVAAIVGSMFTGGMTEETIDIEALKSVTAMLREQIGRTYPPAVWFGRALGEGSLPDLLLFTGVSAAVFVLLIAVLEKSFLSVCTALNATSAKNNYRLGGLSTHSVVVALWKKELKRYFASSIYVSNTMLGYILMVILAVGVLIAGAQTVDKLLGFEKAVEKALPIVLGLTSAIMPVTSCAVSLEGKQWWIAQTLPVKAKTLWDAKILLNLSLAFPFYAVAEALCMAALRPSAAEAVWLMVLPLVYILFSAVVGITINLAMPVFDWDNEVRVVKQSASTFTTTIVGMVNGVVPLAAALCLGEEMRFAVYGVTALVLVALTAVFYVKNGKKQVGA